MKCLILAGGKGGRLWPLSRNNYPKQFIPIQRDHSVFQETISNNISLCDEFIIVTNYEYRFILQNQIQNFRGITYRCIFEEEGRDRTAAIALACMTVAPSEIIFVVSANHMVKGEEYREEILMAKARARSGKIVVLKTQEDPAAADQADMLLFQAGDFLYELEKFMPDFYRECVLVFRTQRNSGRDIHFPKNELMKLQSIDITKSILQRTNLRETIVCNFRVQHLNELEDLYSIDHCSQGAVLEYESSGNLVVNECSDKLVLTNGLQDTVVINTDDAIYIGKKGQSSSIKEIGQGTSEFAPFFEKSKVTHRHWGTYELIIDEPNYSVKRVKIDSGATIYSHRHLIRKERWIIVRGTALITLDGNCAKYEAGDCISVEIDQIHQVSNIGNDILLIIEIATGENVHEEDMVSVKSRDLTAAELGMPQDLLVKLKPVFKDYIWGGTKIRDYFGKNCDYDRIAESWEVSAHEAGQCIVDSGRYKGLKFRDYLNAIGRDKLGWKCNSMKEFPLLIKFIDAKEDLSVQVHPDDEYAWEAERDNGKSELWYVVDAEDGAGIYLGFRRNTSPEEVRNAVCQGKICDLLRWIPVKKGDVFHIEAGTVHAAGRGILICEIQQSSNVTYRLYDYDRRDKYGRKRELHLQKALSVIHYEVGDHTHENRDLPADHAWGCKYFTCKKYEISSCGTISVDESSFVILVCIEGTGHIEFAAESFAIKSGDCFFIPANTAAITIKGELTLLVVRL